MDGILKNNNNNNKTAKNQQPQEEFSVPSYLPKIMA